MARAATHAAPAYPVAVSRYPDLTGPAAVTPTLHRFPARTMPFTVQRDEDFSDAPTAAEPQAEPLPEPSTPTTPSAPQSSQPPAPPPPGPQEPEELLKTLFDPLLRRLRTELRLDRERRGVISDRW